ncbi:MAG TPA: Do family serine endopeptidase [Gammaproteobacteria bacterium]|nr:Do family serine endopeptidase [Gammaproteobacteria bacterium]
MQAFVKTISVTLFVAAFFTYFFTNFSVFTTQEDSKQPFFQVAEARPPAGSGPVSYSSAVKAASPAVVNINTEKVVTVRSHPYFSDPVFKQMFGNLIVDGSIARKRIENSLGSGVIINPDGYILTNNHVIQGADTIQVSLKDGRSSTARVIGTDPETDIALLKIDLNNLPVITIGDSEQLEIGDVVLAIGNPFGVGQTVTMGIVSATGRTRLGINTFENFIQTDAAINPGNSGGALVDAYGKLIGINTAIFSRSGGSQGIGFAIPSKMAKNIMEQLIKYGHAVRGWLGFEGHALTPRLVESLQLETTEGIIITAIVRNGPAHKAGLEPGDVIAGIDGKKVKSGQDALVVISGKKPGEKVTLIIKRNGRQYSVTATTIARPPQAISEVTQ